MKTKRRRSPLRGIVTAVLVLLILGAAAWGGWIWYDNNIDRSGWAEEDGAVYYKDFHGNYVTGWQKIGGRQYYFAEDGQMLRSWQTIRGETYYFDTDGTLCTHWQNIDGVPYYFGADGCLKKGWQEIAGVRYYLDDRGALFDGWLSDEEQRYYLVSGVPQTGWQTIAGSLYHFEDSGEMSNGWQEVEGKRYYFQGNGTPLTGLAAIDGNNYCFNEDGTMHTGWRDTEAGKTYYQDDGSQAFGWVELGGKRYHFGDDGILQTGWYQEGEYSYYLLEDGSAAVGPTRIGGETYYFTPKGIHVVLVNAAHPMPGYYNPNLVTVTGWHQVADVCLEPLKKMLSDCEAAGIIYNFNSAHRTVEEQTMILEQRTAEYIEEGMEEDEALKKALKTVAYPGTSEHHLGLAVDLLGKEAVAWLTEHCWDYGFIVRYTEDKQDITGISDEPWHFRYVGTEVSLDMKDSGLCLEEYLGAA